MLTQAVDPSGVPNLDQLLGGGLPRGALVLLMGPPGSGKTTLATQIAFAAAHAGRRALILTALSEPTNKLVSHLRTFRFFDESLLGDAVQVLSLQQFLPQGLSTTADELVALVRRTRAGLAVIDGFRGLSGGDTNQGAARQFLYDVGTALSVMGATTLITSEAEPRDSSLFPEATTADVLLGIHYQISGMRHQRLIEAVKVRGAAPLSGLHVLTLDGEGARVYPRLESRITAENAARDLPDEEGDAAFATPGERDLDERLPFGLPELDALFGGGVTRETSTLLLGDLGTGKTLLALHFAMARVRAGEPVLLLGFRENLRQLLLLSQPFNLDPGLPAALAQDGGLTFLRFAPVELQADIIASRILAVLGETGARVLIVDSIAELERAVVRSGDPERVEDFFAALLEALRGRGVTSIFIKEGQRALSPTLDIFADALSVLAENVLMAAQVAEPDRVRRVLSVLKMRFSAHDVLLREFRITPPSGIVVLPVPDGTLGQVSPHAL